MPSPLACGSPWDQYGHLFKSGDHANPRTFIAGKVSGYVCASQHAARAAYRYSVNTAVYVAPEARRTGVGRALYSILLMELTHRGFHAAFAGIALPNPASVALCESLGFEPLGVYREVGFKFGRRHDVGWWQRLL